MPKHRPEYVCSNCGAVLDADCKAHSRRFCGNCAAQRGRVRKRRTAGYICVDAPDRVWLDGWFSCAEMEFMLKAGNWPEGIIFEHRGRGVQGSCPRKVMPVRFDMSLQPGQSVPEFPPQHLIEIGEIGEEARVGNG